MVTGSLKMVKTVSAIIGIRHILLINGGACGIICRMQRSLMMDLLLDVKDV